MKKILIPIFIATGLLISGFSHGQAGSIDIGIRGNDCDQLVVEWNSTYSFVGVGQNQWTQSTMTIAWPQALGATTLGTITSLLPGFTNWQYNGTAVLVGTEYRQEIILSSGSYTQDIPIGVTEVIFITLNGSGTGDFNLSLFNPDGVQSTNISSGNHAGEIWSGTFNPASASGVSLDDKIVWNGTEWCGGSGTNYQPGAGDTKPCYVTGLNGQLTVWGATVGSLTVELGGELTIMPGASLTNNGATIINQPQGFIIGADASGSGSFIDNGTITYGGSGSAEVETYIKNNVTAGSFYIHQFGPTVNDPSFPTTYPSENGIFLGALDLQTSGTYAYRYLEPSNSWENIYPITTPVPRGSGILLSTTNGIDATLSLVGTLTTAPSFITTTTSSNPDLVPYVGTLNASQGNGLYMGSNPFPSGLDLKLWRAFMTGAGAGIGNSLYVWDQSASTYSVATQGFGWTYTGVLSTTSAVINPGQGFFAQFTNLSFNFFAYDNTLRAHLHAPFIKDTEFNENLLVRLVLNNDKSKDEIVVSFADGASASYDDFYDGLKWFSMIEEASELMTMSDDNIALTINFMPELDNQPLLIPMHMKCGTTGNHQIEMTELLNFGSNIEIYLEDLFTGGEWINLNNNPVYIFTSTIDDPLHRFNLHFFNTTGIDDPVAQSAIRIYGYGQDAYIVNRGNETVQEYVAYDMMGRELHRGTLPNSTVNKVTIGNVSAYYIVKVITKEGNVYTDKVFISQ